MRIFTVLTLCLFFNSYAWANNQTSNDPLVFDDYPLRDELSLPNWFSLSFLDLENSLNDAIKEGKKGIILYFGRKDCAYCKTLLEVNWGDPAIAKFTQQHFNVIAIDVRGDRIVTDFEGNKWSEKEFAAHKRTNFTPSLLFYNSKKQLALKLSGYRPKYQFRAALEYVADAHYYMETFRQYLNRAETALSFGLDELNEHDSFISPPYNLQRKESAKQKPLVVFFEHPHCHACDILHGDTLSKEEVTNQLLELDVIQLNSMSNTPVITPDGKKISAQAWAEELNITFAPSLIFFDEAGKEILRVESVIRFYRLNNVLRYIIGKEYKNFPTFQAWLHEDRKKTKISPSNE